MSLPPQTPFDRIFLVTGCRSQARLAEVLDISQSNVSAAISRNKVPAEWLILLLRLYGVHPDWILTGKGTCYLLPMPRAVVERLKKAAASDILLREFLRCFPESDLHTELRRRTKKR